MGQGDPGGQHQAGLRAIATAQNSIVSVRRILSVFATTGMSQMGHGEKNSTRAFLVGSISDRMSFPKEATHPRCYGEGYPDRPGRSSKQGGRVVDHHSEAFATHEKRIASKTSIVQQRGWDHGKGNSRAYYVADHMIDARSQTGTAPDEQTAMRYPARASELDHRRLQIPQSPLHDPSPNQLRAGVARRTPQSCPRCLTKDIRE
jgi:hypothetical protein